MPDAITQDSESEIQYPPSILEDVTKLVQRVQTFTGATGAAIALREGEEMVCRASRGSNAPDVGMILSLEGTFAGLAVTGMKALRCDDAESDPRTDPEISRVLRIRSMAVVPVLSGTRVSGVIATFSSTVNAFSDTHMAVLKTMADGLGAAIQRWQEAQPAPVVQKPAPPPPPPPPAPKVEAPRPEPPRVETPKPAPPAPPVRQAAPPPPPPPKIEVPKPVAPRVEPPKPVLKPIAPAAAAPAPAMEKPVEKPAPKKAEPKQQGKWKPVSAASTKEEEVPEPKTEKAEKKSEPVPFSYGMEQSSEGGKGKIIGIAAVAVLAIGGVGYYFYSSSQKTTPAPVPVASTAPATSSAATTGAPAPTATPAAATTSSAANQPDEEEERPATPAMRVQAPSPSRAQATQDVSAPQIAMGAGTGPNLGLSSGGNVRLAAPAPSTVVVPSRMLQRVNPIYPQAAAASRAAGDVTMSATVGADGHIKGIKVLSGHPLLRDAAVRAFQQWRYAPSTVNGRPVDSPITVTVSFKRSE